MEKVYEMRLDKRVFYGFFEIVSVGKRRRRRPSGSDGEEGTQSGSNSGGNGTFPSFGMWTPRSVGLIFAF